MTACPYCAEAVPQPAPAKCPACGERLAAPAGPPPKPLPVGPLILGWFNLAFGGIGLFSPLILVFLALVPRNPADPFQAAMATSGFFRAWIYGGQVLAFLGAILLLASGVGLLRWREWARRASMAYAVYTIVMLVLGFFVTLQFIILPSLRGPMSPAQVGAIGGAFGSCLGLIYPVATLLVLRRPVVMAVFAEQERLRAQGL